MLIRYVPGSLPLETRPVSFPHITATGNVTTSPFTLACIPQPSLLRFVNFPLLFSKVYYVLYILFFPCATNPRALAS